MSVEFYSPSRPVGNDASLQGTTVGGSKPLHRFMKGQPKLVGIIVLILGVSFFIVAMSVNVTMTYNHISSTASPSFIMGTLLLICGILYILTEHNPTKKFVTLSLAFSIVTILGGFWCFLHTRVILTAPTHYGHYDYDDNTTYTRHMEGLSYTEIIELCLDAIFLFYTCVSIVIFIVMSSLAGAALRSTKSQAVVVMTTMPTQAAAE